MAFVKVISGTAKGQKILIDRDEVIIGRDPENVIPIEDVAASSRHCAILREGRKYTLHDLESTNGTRLNGVRITEYRLSPKDIITVGGTELLFDGDDIEAEDAVPHHTQRSNVTVRIDAAEIAAEEIPFQAKRDNKTVWYLVVGALVALALIAGAWYLVCLFKTG